MRVFKFHHELDFLEVMLADKFKRSPGMLKVEGRLRVFTPTARETEVSFVSRVLQQYFHQVAFDCLIFFFFVSLNFPFPPQQAELESSGVTITSGAMGSTLRAAILYGSAPGAPRSAYPGFPQPIQLTGTSETRSPLSLRVMP